MGVCMCVCVCVSEWVCLGVFGVGGGLGGGRLGGWGGGGVRACMSMGGWAAGMSYQLDLIDRQWYPSAHCDTATV